MYLGRQWTGALLVVSLLSLGRAAEPQEWRALLAVPDAPALERNAFPRWIAAAGALADAAWDEAVPLPEELPAPEELSRLGELVEKHARALEAFELRAGELARLPPGFAIGHGLPAPGAWQALARLKALQVRVAWWNGQPATAAEAAADLVGVATAAAGGANDLRGWLMWNQIATQAFDTALWVARQVDVTDHELAPLSRALAAGAGAWPEGAIGALRGEFTHGFRSALRHLPDTRDIATMLDALAGFGLPALPSGHALELGVAEKALLDRAEAEAMLGQAVATFIRDIQEDPLWRHAHFGEDFARASELWLAELGLFGELALGSGLPEYPPDRLEEVAEAMRAADNPVGKLLVVYGAPNFEGIAYEGNRIEAHRRCARVLVEWRRRIVRGEPLPSTVEAWADFGVTAGEIQDPFNGNPLVFDPDTLRVWSVGLDGVNNHGRVGQQSGVDGVDLVWSLGANEAPPLALPDLFK